MKKIQWYKTYNTQLAEAVEYTDCTSAEGVRLPQQVS